MRAQSSAVLTRVLSHVYLRDPDIDFDSLLEPMSGDLAAAAAEAVKGRAEALLGRFRAFSVLPGRGAASSTAPGGGSSNVTPPQAAAPLKSDPFASSVLFLFLQHAPCLAEAFKLVFDILKQSMACNICFEFLGICIFLPYLLVLYVGRARPRAYLNHR